MNRGLPFVINLGLLVNLAPNEGCVMSQEGNHGMGLIHKHPGVILDIHDPLCFEIGSRPVGVILAPLPSYIIMVRPIQKWGYNTNHNNHNRTCLNALLSAPITLVHGLAHRVMREGQDCVGISITQIRDLVGGDAVDRDSQGYGECRAILLANVSKNEIFSNERKWARPAGS